MMKTCPFELPILKKHWLGLFLLLLFSAHLPLLAENDTFFPRGIYTSDYRTFDTLIPLGFNLFVGPKSDTDFIEAKKRGIKLIPILFRMYTSHLEKMKRNRDNPTILAWYPFDEPDIYNLDYDTYADWRRQIKQISPQKPIFLTIWNPRKFERWSPLADILGISPYPFISDSDESRNRIESVFLQTRYASRVRGSRPFYVLIQCFYQYPWWQRSPTPTELHNMVYQALAGGANGIIFFTYEIKSVGVDRHWYLTDFPELMTEIRQINDELSSLENVLVNGKVLAHSRLDTSGIRDVYMLKEFGGKVFLIAANPLAEPVELEFRIPGAREDIGFHFQSPGTRGSSSARGSFKIHLPPLGWCAVSFSMKKH